MDPVTATMNAVSAVAVAFQEYFKWAQTPAGQQTQAQWLKDQQSFAKGFQDFFANFGTQFQSFIKTLEGK